MTAAVIGAALILLVLWESFETLVLPRRVTRRLRMTRLYYRASWGFWRRIGRQHPGQRRENYLSVFAPLSLLLLLAIWVGGVVLGFALIQFGLDTPLRPGGDAAFATHLYLSATTFVTLGLGDVTSASSTGRAITAIEAAAGFAFLALTISYLPVLYQAFSRREVRISMLDQWAGSPPSAVELLRRAAAHGEIGSVDELLAAWERWSAELLESHLTYPVLAYFRSQHEQQSWLAALDDDPGHLGAGAVGCRRRVALAGAAHLRDLAARDRRYRPGVPDAPGAALGRSPERRGHRHDVPDAAKRRGPSGAGHGRAAGAAAGPLRALRAGAVEADGDAAADAAATRGHGR